MVEGDADLEEDVLQVLDECLGLLFTLESQIKNPVSSQIYGADSDFDVSQFWQQMSSASESLSKEATLFSLAFCSGGVRPTAATVKQLCDKIQTPCVAVVSIFLNALPMYPKIFGCTCWNKLSMALLELIQSARRLVVSVKNPNQINRQMQDTGTVFEACDSIKTLPKTAKEAFIVLSTENLDLISDALYELECHDEENETLKPLLNCCIAIIRATKATLAKVVNCIKQNDAIGLEAVTQLDNLYNKLISLSPNVDDLATAFYMIDGEESPLSCVPPSSDELGLSALELIDIFTFSDKWYDSGIHQDRVAFLRDALNHNMKKIKDLVKELEDIK